ncbi:MAG: hypothetical protein MK101_12600 [Phycisphaerales bacterium]|nr:hypothetical protein [Phycisphaerales bacterium]
MFKIATALLAAALLTGCGGKMRETAMHRITTPTTLEEVKAYARGQWSSISVELRPHGRSHRRRQGAAHPPHP